MKTFYGFLLEANMPLSDAMKILGLSGGFTADDLKKAYRAASIANHPDRGGSTAKMQDINVANDVLSKNVGVGGKYAASGADSVGSREWWAARAEKAKAFARVAMEHFDSIYRPVSFQKHFDTVMGQGFTITTDQWVPFEGRSTSGDWVTRNTEWANADRSIVFYANMSVYFKDMFDAKTIAAADTMLTATIHTEILYNRKKVKLSQQNYSWAKTKDAIQKPEFLFPATKLKSQTKKSSGKALSKADAYLTFKRELNAMISDPYVYIPVGEYVIQLQRMVFMRVGMWRVDAVYKMSKYGGAAGAAVGGYIKTNTIYEEWAHMTPLFNVLKQLQKENRDPAYMVQVLTATIEYIKTLPTELGSKPMSRF